MKRYRLASSLCAGLAVLAGAAASFAGVTITAGSIGGSGSAIGDGFTPDAFACAGVPSATSCAGSFGLSSPSCDIQSNQQASESAQVPLSATGGGAGTSGGLGDDPDVTAIARADAQGFVTADATALGTGLFTINMCGTTTATPSGGLSTLAEYSANINTPGIKFVVTLPGNTPVPFTEEYTGVFASLAGTPAFAPDASAPNPGAITQVNGQSLIAPGAYELVKSFSRTAGNRFGNDATFTGGYRLTVGTNGSVGGACCFSTGCTVVTSPTECRGLYLGEGSTCDQCNGLDECCQPWDNGRDDRRGGQTSQIGVDQDWRTFSRVSFDDFWLCDGEINIVRTVRGTMNTNSVVPKVLVVILPDCNGRPVLTEPIAVAGLAGTRFDVDQDDVPFVLGRVEILDISRTGPDGLRSIEARAHFDLDKRLVLKGGAYWVTFIGVSGTLDPLDEFFWATSGNNVVKGKPGAFYDGEEWFDSDQLCCGCTDYNFCIQGETCKILLDNGGPIDNFGQIQFPGIASLQNGGNTQTKSRAADKFVVPPCTRFEPCYVEGWMWTNCDRIGLELYRDDCRCPNDDAPAALFAPADCVMGTGIRRLDPSGVEVELKKAQWFLSETVGAQITGAQSRSSGFNLWLSLFGLGDNRQNARAYFAFGGRCDRPCDSFGPGCFRPAPFDQTTWRPNGLANTSVPGFDHAFLIAIREARVILPPAINDCPADINRSGEVTVQDIFDFLAAFFTGCP